MFDPVYIPLAILIGVGIYFATRKKKKKSDNRTGVTIDKGSKGERNIINSALSKIKIIPSAWKGFDNNIYVIEIIPHYKVKNDKNSTLADIAGGKIRVYSPHFYSSSSDDWFWVAVIIHEYVHTLGIGDHGSPAFNKEVKRLRTAVGVPGKYI